MRMRPAAGGPYPNPKLLAFKLPRNDTIDMATNKCHVFVPSLLFHHVSCSKPAYCSGNLPKPKFSELSYRFAIPRFGILKEPIGSKMI